MEANAFQVAVIAELTALKYVLEHVGKIAFIAADLRPEHATAMREAAREKLLAEVSPALGPFGRTTWRKRLQTTYLPF